MSGREASAVRRSLTLALGSASYFLFLFSWFLLPAFLTPVIDDLGLSETAAGVLNGAVPLVYVPLGLASGLVVERVGWRRGIGAGLLVLGTGQALRSAAVGFPTMLLPTLLIGVGGMGVTFGLPKLVSALFPPDRSGRASAVYLVGSSLGSATAFALARPVIGPLLGGWRPAFRWSGVLVVAFALGWLLLARVLVGSTPPDREEEAGGDGGDGGVGAATFSLASLRRDVGQVLGHRALRLIVVVGTMYLFVIHGTQTWLPRILEARGASPALAGTLGSLLILSNLAGVVTIPPLSERLGTRRWTVVACGGLAAAGVVGLAGAGASLGPVAAVVVATGVGLGGLSPLVRSIPIELDGIGPRLTATATGLIFSVGEIGGFLGPFVVGSLRDATGTFATGLLVLSVGGAVVVAAGLAMSEPAA
jgi:cyanate permease